METRKVWKVEELAFKQQELVFKLTLAFPKDENFGLTSQIRRSSRSVGANLVEAYRKAEYPQHFILKMTDADAENSETAYWLKIALSCNYCGASDLQVIWELNSQIGKLLNYMKRNREKFIYK